MEQTINPSEFVAYQVLDDSLDIVRASHQRDWIDRFPDSFPYWCLPLLMANQYGWEIVNPSAFTATWDGGSELSALTFKWEGEAVLSPSSLFGFGILSFGLGYVFTTPPGVDLLVTGPFNLPKLLISPLSGVIETDWIAAPFLMNYMFNAPGSVEFSAGEPICRIIPVQRGLMENLDTQIRHINENPELKSRFEDWMKKREAFIRREPVFLSTESKKKWTKTYFSGNPSLGAPPADHTTKLRLREFIPSSYLKDVKPAKPVYPAEVRSELKAGRREAISPDDVITQGYIQLIRGLSLNQRASVLSHFCDICGRDSGQCDHDKR